MKILITGSKGQLGQSLQQLATHYPAEFIYTDKAELDITQAQAVDAFFAKHLPQIVINASAYTQVDKAETEQEAAYMVNATAVAYLATACTKYKAKLLHISTDFVFDGLQSTPYKESDTPNPLGVYGASKLAGEKNSLLYAPNALVIRTSWLYAAHGHNFVNTILRLANERPQLQVVADQIGSPTYALDLAQAILKICFHKNLKEHSGIYHFSNQGVCSWYDFALEIISMSKISCAVLPIETLGYPTPAQRPPFSVLNKSKIIHDFQLEIPHWKFSLQMCLKEKK